MNPLRSPRLMLLVLVALMAAPSWAATVTVALGALTLAAKGVTRLAREWPGRHRPAADTLLLGTGRDGRPVAISDRELSAHGLILGASGSGKTTALVTILEQQISRGLPVVAIDMKGSPTFAAQLARAAAAAGRSFRLWTPDGPGFWNPLQHGNATEGKDKLIGAERFSEPHYQRAAERYLQNLLQVLRHVHPERAPTLDEVVELMNPDRLPALLRRVPEPLAERVQDYREGLSSDQLSAIRGLGTRLAVITESEAGAYLRPHGAETIDLRSALEGREVVLFSLNSSRYGKFASQLGTLVVQDLVCASGMRLESTAARAPALVAIDEFSGIGGEHVVALFARGREAGVQVLVATQEMADLDRAARGVRDQVLGSTALKLILRQDVPESAHTVAQLAGTERVWEETQQIAGGLLFRGPPGRGTRREVERFLIHPNEIKSLSTGEAVLISKLRGQAPQMIRVRPTPAVPVRDPAVGPPRSAPARAESDRFGGTIAANRSASRVKRRLARSSGRPQRLGRSPSEPQRPPPRRYDPGVTR